MSDRASTGISRCYSTMFCSAMLRPPTWWSKALAIRSLWDLFDSVNIWCIVFLPVLKPLACGRQSRCLGWTYKLPGGYKFSIKLSPLSVGFPQRRPLNLIKKNPIYKLPRGSIYKLPCVQLINSPFFAVQVFALSISICSNRNYSIEVR